MTKPNDLLRFCAVLAALLAVLCLLAVATPAASQVFDLRSILGGSESGEPADPATEPPRAPLQSLPVPAFDPASAPTVDDYARIAGREPGAPAALGRLGSAVSVFQSRLSRLIDRVPDATGEITSTLAGASPTGQPAYFLGVAIFAALLLVIGRAVTELYGNYVARPIFVSLQRDHPDGFADRVPVLGWRIVLTVIGIALSLFVAGGIGLGFNDGHYATLATVIVIFTAYAAIMAIDTVWRMTLAPYLPAYRLPRISDGEARRLYRWTTGVSSFAVASTALCHWGDALGLPREIHVIVTVGLTLITLLLLIALVRRNHAIVDRMVLGGRDRRNASVLRVAFSTLWAPVTVLFLVGVWLDLVFRMVMGIAAEPLLMMVPFMVLIGGMTIYAVTIALIERAFRRQRRIAAINQLRRERAERRSDEETAAMVADERQRTHFGDSTADEAADAGDDDGEGSALEVPRERPSQSDPAVYQGMRTMEDLARRVAALLAIGVAAYALIRFWGGADIFERIGFLGILSAVLDVLLIGYIIFHAARIWMDQKIAEEVGDEPDDGAIMDGEGGGAGATRLATLLPLVRNAVLIVIGTAVALIVATELGVNVAPLFAGAGILGLAIGFGSQTLVRDILSGMFFLLDDAFRKGEYIDVGDVKGTVERISLRSFQLRHHLGMLHTIPFGEIQFLTNFSRDWVMMKLPLRLTYDTDVEKVRKLIKKLGLALLEDETVGEKFLAPLKSQGVIQMEDSAMIIRVKFMTRPGDQWVVRKRVYQEIRELFEREGIKFAHREVTVRIPDLPKDRPLDEDEKQMIGAAARNTLDVVEAGQMPRTGTGGDDR